MGLAVVALRECMNAVVWTPANRESMSVCRIRASPGRDRPRQLGQARLGAGGLAGLSPVQRVRQEPNVRSPRAEPRRYRLMDLFAGCGGMTRGFVDTGRYEPVFAVEMDADAAATYAANFGADARRRRQDRGRRALPAGRRRHRRPALPGLLAAQPRRRRPRTARALARVPARARESEPAAFVMENVPELLRSARVRRVQDGAPSRSSATRVEGRILNAADYGVPQRRRRAIVIGVRDGADPMAGADTLRPGEADPARRRSRGARSATPSKGCRASRTGEGLAHRPQPAAGDDRPLPGTSRTTAATASRCRTASTRAGLGHLVPALLAQQADRHHRRLRPALLGPAGVHDPHRVLQAREGPLPPPERGPADHDPRGRPLHELPRRLRLPERPEVDGDREADRQRRAAAARPRRSPGRSRTRWTSRPIRCAVVLRETLTL